MNHRTCAVPFCEIGDSEQNEVLGCQGKVECFWTPFSDIHTSYKKFMEHTNSTNLCMSMFVTGMMCDKIEMKTCSNCSLKFACKLSGKKKH